MVHFLMQGICLLLVSSSYLYTQAFEDTSVPHYLDLVIGIFRHGDRAPLRSFPTDRNRHSKFWILGYGELTRRGIRTMRNVGKYLKERYKTYLTGDPKETNVRSSPKPRCFNSASILLYELYPSKPPRQVALGEQWFPFPITRMPEDHDKYTLTCKPKIKKMVMKLLNPFGGLFGLTWFLTRAAPKLGLRLPRDAAIIPDTLDALLVQKEYGLTIPRWFEKRLLRLSDVSRRLYVLIAEELMMNMGAEILRDIATLLEGRYHLGGNKTKEAIAIAGLHTRKRHAKLILYSYHDLNIMATLKALNKAFSQKPYYGSFVFFEVTRQNQSKLEIKILYRNGTAQPEVVPVDGCPSPCRVTQFIKLVRKKFPRPFRAETCGYPKDYVIL